MSLLLDLGNTRLKAALLPDATATPNSNTCALAHGEAGYEVALAHWLQAHVARGAQAWLAAVAPEAVLARTFAVLDAHGLRVERVRTRDDVLGLRLAYRPPASLGVDRWLAMLAARERDEAGVLVVGVGSALTVDAIDARGHHLGGLIAPSPEGMRAALLARAPALAGAAGEMHAFARSTPDAIASGCLLSAVGLVERSLVELQRACGGTGRLLLAGGGAEPMRAWLPPHDYVPDLVLRGLARWVRHRAPLQLASDPRADS